MTPKEIKELRVKLGISQQAFSNAVGVTVGTVNRWERGLCKPSPIAFNIIKRLQGDRK